MEVPTCFYRICSSLSLTIETPPLKRGATRSHARSQLGEAGLQCNPRMVYNLAQLLRDETTNQHYDLVMASYVLGEFKDEVERLEHVFRLWQLTAAGGMLVLAGPGTPTGFKQIVAAREAVLQHEWELAEAAAARARRCVCVCVAPSPTV